MDQDFPKTPESFKLALKQQVEKEMANENDRSEDIKKMVEINPSNTKKKRRKWVKIAVAAVALIGLMSWWCLCGNKIRCISAYWS